MESKKVRFVEDVKVLNREGREFKKGEVYELPASSADRWILRGKAEAAPDEGGEAGSGGSGGQAAGADGPGENSGGQSDTPEAQNDPPESQNHDDGPGEGPEEQINTPESPKNEGDEAGSGGKNTRKRAKKD